jgi:hypothetical protein
MILGDGTFCCRRKTQGDHLQMKKILALAIGLGLVLGNVTFAQDKTDTTKTEKKKKTKKSKKTDTTAKKM